MTVPSHPTLTPSSRWALLGLTAVVAVTCFWWMLALWPLPDEAPEWLVRTRVACFGTRVNGLPDAGGWIMLVGQPVGMLIFLIGAWGPPLRDGLAWLARHGVGRLVLGVAAVTLFVGAGAATTRVLGARGVAFDPTGGPGGSGPLIELTDPAPALDLVDQHGQRVTLHRFADRPVLLTFAFAHCETVCPFLVRNALDAAGRSEAEPVVVVISLDPWRDTPSRLPTVAARWGMGDGAHVLSGSVDEVEETLTRWKIPRIRNAANGDIVHPAVTYVVQRGRLRYQTDGRAESLVAALNRLGTAGSLASTR